MAPTAGKNITQAELNKHNRANDCWVAYRGKVYDLTPWVAKHPGGEDPLALNAGRDFTVLFECYHDPRHKKMMEKYYIGEFTGDVEYPTFPEPSKFYLEMKEDVAAYFKKQGYSQKYAPKIFLSAAFLVFTTFYMWYLSTQTTSALAYLYAAISGVAGAFICFQPVHEGSHFATTGNPWVHRALGSLLDFCNGGSYYIWLHQHFLGHHPFTNVTEGHGDHSAVDPDVLTNDPDARRITPRQKYFGHYQWQHIYVPFVYCFLSIKFRIGDVKMLYGTKMNGIVRINPPPFYHEFVFWAGKAFWFSYRIIGTALLTGSLWRAFTLYCVYDAVMSYVLALVFQVNHVVPQADWPEVDPKTNHVDMDWAEMQVRTTMDYSHNNSLVHYLVGGLNYQTIHHLFPYVSQVHYIALGDIVKAKCKKYDIKFNYVPTYKDALMSHISHLKQMGNKLKATEMMKEMLDVN